MLRKIRLAQPKDRKGRHTIFPKNICQCFCCPDVLLQMSKWERTERGCNRSKRVMRARFSGKKRDTIFRTARIDMSIQQKANSFCSSNYGTSAHPLDKLGDGWKGNIFSIGEFISLLHRRRNFDV